MVTGCVGGETKENGYMAVDCALNSAVDRAKRGGLGGFKKSVTGW